MRTRATLAAALITGLAAAQPVLAEESVLVTMDQAKIMRLSAPASTIIIGNPSIADVTMQDSQTLVITGRSYGTTNLLIMDAEGEMLSDTQVSVEAPTLNTITLYKGPARFTYSCVPFCQGALVPGDAPDHFATAAGQAGARNGAAAGSATATEGVGHP